MGPVCALQAARRGPELCLMHTCSSMFDDVAASILPRWLSAEAATSSRAGRKTRQRASASGVSMLMYGQVPLQTDCFSCLLQR